jgi:hypothetical protein
MLNELQDLGMISLSLTSLLPAGSAGQYAHTDTFSYHVRHWFSVCTPCKNN